MYVPAVPIAFILSLIVKTYKLLTTNSRIHSKTVNESWSLYNVIAVRENSC